MPERWGVASGPGGVTPGQYSFAQVPNVEMQRSVFNRSCGLKTAFDAGLLIPIFLDEVLPGDTFRMVARSFVRLATPNVPVMDNLHLDLFFFFIPTRLVWDNFQKFMGEQRNPGDSTDFLVPIFDEATVAEDSLSDYLGLPLGAGLDFISLPHRCYNLVYNRWFRDQNLINSAVVDVDDGPDTLSDYVIRRRGKRHDYFTSCLPFAQKGAAVSLPLGTTAPVTGTPVFASTGLNPVFAFGGGANTLLSTTVGAAGGAVLHQAGTNVGNMAWVDAQLGAITSGLTADLSAATAASINLVRERFQIQRLLERDARGGTRYVEILKSHFQVDSPDQRLQNPEYLGGGTHRINFHPVAVTNDTASAFPGELGAFATSGGDVGWMKSFVEHGYVLGIASVRADLSYQQGMNRLWFRRTRYEYYWPAFAHLGEQAVLNKEIFAGGNPVTDDAVFGFQERYAEYRYKPSMITGKMRSTAATPIDFWHLAQEFGALPVLNQSFIEEDPPLERVLRVINEKDLIADFWFNYQCARPMPTYSVPGLIDHF